VPLPLFVGPATTALATPILGDSLKVTLVEVLSSPGFPLPFASGFEPAADTSVTVDPPALAALPVALLAYGPRFAPGLTVTCRSIEPLAPVASRSVPEIRLVFVVPL